MKTRSDDWRNLAKRTATGSIHPRLRFPLS
jgi:hypothetical protein